MLTQLLPNRLLLMCLLPALLPKNSLPSNMLLSIPPGGCCSRSCCPIGCCPCAYCPEHAERGQMPTDLLQASPAAQKPFERNMFQKQALRHGERHIS